MPRVPEPLQADDGAARREARESTAKPFALAEPFVLFCCRCGGNSGADGARFSPLAAPAPALSSQVDCPEVDAQLFEFDRRFEQLEKFTFYDYNDPEDVPDYFHHEFDVGSPPAPHHPMRSLTGSRRPAPSPRHVASWNAALTRAARRLSRLRSSWPIRRTWRRSASSRPPGASPLGASCSGFLLPAALSSLRRGCLI